MTGWAWVFHRKMQWWPSGTTDCTATARSAHVQYDRTFDSTISL